MMCPGTKDRHVFLLEDSDGHRICEDRACPCGPAVSVYPNGAVVAHRAWNGQDLIEEAEALTKL